MCLAQSQLISSFLPVPDNRDSAYGGSWQLQAARSCQQAKTRCRRSSKHVVFLDVSGLSACAEVASAFIYDDRWGLANAERMMVKPDQLQLVNLLSKKGNTGGHFCSSSSSTEWAI